MSPRWPGFTSDRHAKCAPQQPRTHPPPKRIGPQEVTAQVEKEAGRKRGRSNKRQVEQEAVGQEAHSHPARNPRKIAVVQGDGHPFATNHLPARKAAGLRQRQKSGHNQSFAEMDRGSKQACFTQASGMIPEVAATALVPPRPEPPPGLPPGRKNQSRIKASREVGPRRMP